MTFTLRELLYAVVIGGTFVGWIGFLGWLLLGVL